MTTAIASPPSFQPLSRLGWNSNAGAAGGLNSMSADEVSRMFMPQRKSIQRTNSSSSVSSNASTSTVSPSQQPATTSSTNGEPGQWSAKKQKPRGGFGPASKVEQAPAGLNVRRQGSTSAAQGTNGTASMSAAQQPSPIVPSQQNGARNGDSTNGANESPAVLALLPLNGTFERKQISVPLHPAVLKVGRQTNAKTVPTPVNGYFDSKVLSRAHAEVWAERSGKIWIRDVKSSNGTFVNGQRLSPENRDSEPHEIREHDTLELGIDIVSEDQKSIVHHKVSAKVDFAGIYGTPNNVLDLNFGDLDPSQGGGLLASPLGQAAGQHRGRPAPPYNRTAPSSMSAGSQLSALGQQRHMNMWGIPMGVEHLVKVLSNEMKQAKQQAQDLDQTSDFLNALLSSDRRPEKSPAKQTDSIAAPHVSEKPRLSKIDPIARFSDPPAPPPQHPLPEKPAQARSSPIEPGGVSPLKRNDMARPGGGMVGSPTNPHSSQILSLIEALSSARRELDSQGTRVKHLEDMLRQERSARESAEERARRLEQNPSFKPTSRMEREDGDTDGSQTMSGDESCLVYSEPSDKQVTTINGFADDTISTEDQLQSSLKQVLDDMDRMRQDMQNFQRRAESAEEDASSTRASLTDMIERLRQENAEAAAVAEREVFATDSDVRRATMVKRSDKATNENGSSSLSSSVTAITSRTKQTHQSRLPNGHVGVASSSRLPENLERAIATLLRTDTSSSTSDGQQHLLLAQSAPYASMLGVVLVGVGLMAYLNSWQKIDK